MVRTHPYEAEFLIDFLAVLRPRTGRRTITPSKTKPAHLDRLTLLLVVTGDPMMSRSKPVLQHAAKQ
jgi:hypothetical protein